MRIKYILPIIYVFLCSCTGEFSPTTKATIELSGPDQKCEEGTIDPANPNLLGVDFTWKTSDDVFDEATLIIMNEEKTEELVKKTIDVSLLRTTITLERGKWFHWKIEANASGSNDLITMKEKRFYSELISTEGAPYPVTIKLDFVRSEAVQFSWESPEEDPNRNFLQYKAYYTAEPVADNTPISKLVFTELVGNITSTTAIKRVTINGANLEANSTYYFKVESIVTKDNNALSSNTYYKFDTN